MDWKDIRPIRLVRVEAKVGAASRGVRIDWEVRLPDGSKKLWGADIMLDSVFYRDSELAQNEFSRTWRRFRQAWTEASDFPPLFIDAVEEVARRIYLETA